MKLEIEILECKKCKMARTSKIEIEVGKSGRKCQNIEIKRKKINHCVSSS